jgi:hypothetical protein
MHGRKNNAVYLSTTPPDCWEADVVCAAGCQSTTRKTFSSSSLDGLDEMINLRRCSQCGGPMKRAEPAEVR